MVQKHPPPFIHGSVTALRGEVGGGAHILDPEALPAIHDVQRINEALLVYLHELEQIDIEAFKRETQEYNKAVRIFSTATTDKELNVLLLDTFEQMGIKKPWQGDFDKHMSDKNATLVFE